MKLLTAEQVKNKQQQLDEEQRMRIAKLRAEETAAVKRVNEALVMEREVKERIAKELEENKAELTVRKTVLLEEVASLEERKREALKPIRETQKEAERILAENVKEGEKLREKIGEFEGMKEVLSEKMEEIADIQAEIKQSIENLQVQEAGIAASKAELKKSTDRLAQEWVRFHKEVHTVNQGIIRRENEIEDGKRANLAFKESLDKVAEEQAQERRRLKDAYETLARAQKEILEKK